MTTAKFHFLGINGSGIAGVACLAKEMGFQVDGCDITDGSDYSEQLRNLGIEVQRGQAQKHLENTDYLVVSPAVFFRDKFRNIDEITYALQQNKKVMRWQQFLDEYLVLDKELICICGTHGKTTTTTITANLLESCGADPSAIIGGINSRWNRSYRNGYGRYFVCEADEYGYNFTYYHPKYILLNNLEMEHPEFFKNLHKYRQNFSNFLKNIKDNGAIIFNADDSNVKKVLEDCRNFFREKNVKLISYSLREKQESNSDVHHQVKMHNDFFTFDNTKFYQTNSLHGLFNVRNLSMALSLLLELGFTGETLNKFTKNCEIAKRRMEKIFEEAGFAIYDDYAHHHTQVKNNLKNLRKSIPPHDQIVVILEPHMISRFTKNSEAYIHALNIANYALITKFFKSREEDLNEPFMDSYLTNTKIVYEPDFCKVVQRVMTIAHYSAASKLHVVVMGAGLSYKLSRKIVETVKSPATNLSIPLPILCNA